MPLRPYTRKNVLTHKANYKQLQADTGVDLASLLRQDVNVLVGLRSGTGIGTGSSCGEPAEYARAHHATTAVSTAASASTSSTTSAGVSVTEKGGVTDDENRKGIQWSYGSLLRGEILMKLAFHTAQQVPVCLREESWAELLHLLTYSRQRGALPPSLALVGEDFCPRPKRRASAAGAVALIEDSQSASAYAPSSDTPLEIMSSIPPTPFARRCYLEAYGLSLSYPTQQNSNSTNANVNVVARAAATAGQATHVSASGSSSASWFSNLGEFLFSNSSTDATSGALNAIHSGNLDIPNLYCNTNASVCVDMTGQPLRPDDELLRVCLDSCRPAQLLFTTEAEEHFAGTSVALNAIIKALTAVVEKLVTHNGVSNNGHVGSLLKSSLTVNMRCLGSSSHDDEDHVKDRVLLLSLSLPGDAGNAEQVENFPAHLLDSCCAAELSEVVCELDGVALLEWATQIVLKDADHVQYFWPTMQGK